MKVLICNNTSKDVNLKCENNLILSLKKYNINFDISHDSKDILNNKYDAMFVIGGDGTILNYVDFANKNHIGIIGINAGNLGFLTEFECSEVDIAVSLLASNSLVKDNRSMLLFIDNDKEYYALNDIVIQRIYTDTNGMLVSLDVFIDDSFIDTIIGDGVIVNTPTGSTAYAFSVGGSILAPKLNAFAITPIASHSYNQRSVVYPSNSKCTLIYNDGTSAGLFVDGKFIKSLSKNDVIVLKKVDTDTIFLRKNNSDFFKQLTKKLKNRAGI